MENNDVKRDSGSPWLSPYFLKMAGMTLLFGVLPLCFASLLLITGYEHILSLFSGLVTDKTTPALTVISEETSRFYVKIFFSLLILFLYVLVGGIIVDYLFSRPIHVIRKFLNNIDWDKPAKIEVLYGDDEIGEFGRALKKVIQDFKRVRERDLSLSKQKDEFLFIAAHQLRTPLTEIKWTLDAALSGELVGEMQQKYLKKTLESVNGMIHLVGDFLNVARIEENRFSRDFKKLDIMPLLNKAMDDYAQLAYLKKVTLTILPPSEVLSPVVIDKEGIELVLSNLLVNAINYTPSGGSVTISTKLMPANYLEISIKDTGIGIPKEEQAMIFSRFFRAANAKSIHPDGSGIGLFISQNIVERHGGKIKFSSGESGESQGTTFVFTLPLLEKDIPDQQKNLTQFFSNLGSV